MDGVMALRTALIADAALLALVPAARIGAGVMPRGTALPLVSLESVSAVDRNVPGPGTRRHVTERVQATVMAASYPAMKAVLRAVKLAAADAMPAVAGIEAVTITTAGTGPDFMDDEAKIHLGTQDFIVGFNETT